MSARYEISEGELDVLAITGPEGTRYIDGEEIEARVIRQQSADIAALQQVISDQILVIEDLDYRRGKVCDENDQLSAELAAAVAERDEARTAYQVRNTEWHQHELIALALAERYKLRAEQAEARLAAIDSAPAVALTFCHPYSREEPGQLIARPAKD